VSSTTIDRGPGNRNRRQRLPPRLDPQGFPVGRRPSAGAPAAATIPSWPRFRRCCPSWASPRELCVRLGDRLLVAVSLLREHVRVSHHSRPRAGDRHGRQMRQPGPVGLGRHRRRRRAVDRHQSPDPHDPAKPRLEHPAVQQPDLRLDQGAVLADFRIRQEDEVEPDGHDRAADPADPDGLGGRGDVRRPHRRLGSGSSARDAGSGGPPPRHFVRRDPAKLPRFQR
jgi:hypothetical protein